MRVLSVNVGLPRPVTWKGRTFTTAFFKEPVAGRVAVGPTQVAGDRQADPRVHGGPDKAVYAYSSDHYPFWRGELGELELPPGSFGENLTLEGGDEREVRIGERWRVGDVELVVTEPRLPCFKLAARFRRPDLVRRFLASRRTGFYLAVRRPGELGAGDPVERLGSDPDAITIFELVELHATGAADLDLVERALRTPGLTAGWRAGLEERLGRER